MVRRWKRYWEIFWKLWSKVKLVTCLIKEWRKIHFLHFKLESHGVGNPRSKDFMVKRQQWCSLSFSHTVSMGQTTPLNLSNCNISVGLTVWLYTKDEIYLHSRLWRLAVQIKWKYSIFLMMNSHTEIVDAFRVHGILEFTKTLDYTFK